ncbi:MAG: substrate-binding domain-containing protein [Planctomycetota bacterium]|nr:substrate-binding domain-containing protein [Planctomycetota bacterium]
MIHFKQFLAASLLLTLLGCGVETTTPIAPGNGSSGGSAGKKLRVGMMPKLVGIDYFNECKKGAEEAAKELGIELTYDGPSEAKVELQVQMIDEWIALGYDVIAVSPNDPEVISAALKRAKDAGILTLTWDADANPTASGRAVFVNQAPVKAVGEKLVDLMAEAIGREGKTVIVTGSATSPNQNAWMKVMKDHLETNYPRIELIETLVPDENQNRARQMTLDVLTAHPDLEGVWGITSVALPGAAEAVRQAEKTGKVYVTGLSLPSTVRSYVKDGTIKQFVLWSPADLGYLTLHTAKALADKKLSPGEQTFGRLRGIQVLKDEVILGPPLVFNQDNIDQYEF